MLKFVFYLNIIVLSIKLNECKFYEKGRLNDNSVNDEATWQNLWFPHPPNYENKLKSENANVAEPPKVTGKVITNKNSSSNWKGLWFPHPPDYQNAVKAEIANTPPTKTNFKDISDESNKTSDWPGYWFPMPPKYGSENFDQLKIKSKTGKMYECDNGKDNLGIDFDPEDKRHSFNYLCMGNRTEYEPNLNTSALLYNYMIPPAYEPPVKCLYEDIVYTEAIPTFGGFRPRAPKFGSYKYLPPQRWLHSLADGAIVLLYQPCAFAGEIERLQSILKGCLYRHIITPSQQLTTQRPLALLAWGKSLQMSVVDDDIVVKFIKENAKMGFRQKQQKLEVSHKFYDAGLLTESHLVTDEQDIEICGYKEMR